MTRATPWLAGALTAAVVCAALLTQALILQNAIGGVETGDCDDDVVRNPNCDTPGDGDIFTVVNDLLDPALWIIVALAPLTIAWGGGMMLFGGRHGPQLMGGAVVAVVLVASAKGIAA